jgi:hypothetical protein
MTRPTASIETDVQQPPAIGEVTVVVYGLEPGQCEIRVRFPDDALPGMPNAVARQNAFNGLVMAELKRALPELGGA